MQDILSDIGSFIFIEDEPTPCDLIVAIGGSFPQIAEKAAALYHMGLAPYVLAGGRYSVKTGHFKGVSDKRERYDGDYRTECEFFCGVLHKNGVPDGAILKEDRSGFTKENATLARALTDALGLTVRSMILVCKRFHARRCQLFFASAFPEARVAVVPVDLDTDGYDLTRDNWYLTREGRERVLGELARCGEQLGEQDLLRCATVRDAV
ncbi:MAG: YdcF family protein [Clostridia bacterium]|nr:YdcF family protein [Clostridia bacterium]